MSDKLFVLGTDYSTFTRSVRLYCAAMGLACQTGMRVHGETLALRTKALCQYHPFGKIPVLLHGSVTVFETTAICRYLDAVHPQLSLRPSNPESAALVDAWAQAISVYVDKAVMSDYVLEFAFPKGQDSTVRLDVIERNLPVAHEQLRIVSQQLAKQDYLCGTKFTMADAVLLPIVDYASKTSHKDKLFVELENLLLYVERMKYIPAFNNIIASHDKK